MARTLLELATVLLEGIGVTDLPLTIAGNSEPSARLALYHLNAAGSYVGGAYDWEELTTEKDLTGSELTDGAGTYALAANVRKVLSATFWDEQQRWPMRGPVTPEQWSALIHGQRDETRPFYFRIRQRNLLVWPVPTNANDHIRYEFVDANWAQDSVGTGKPRFDADTDEPRIDDVLIELEAQWRIRRARGLTYDEEFRGARSRLREAMGEDAGAPVIRFGARVVRRNEFEVVGFPFSDGTFCQDGYGTSG